MLMSQVTEGRIMKTIVYTFLLACSVFLSGCSRAREIPQDRTPEKETSRMIQIQDLTLTDKTLTLDYRVSNPFDDDIRVCHDTNVYGNQEVQHVAARIAGETLWIKLRSNLDESIVLSNPSSIAKYVRVPPGESYSGRILLDLPIRDYSRELRRDGKEHEEIVLHRAIFEVGYFGPKLNKFFDTVSEMIKEEGIEPKTIVLGKYHYLDNDPLIAEEMLDGQSREVLYVGFTLEGDEESVKVVLTDVAIPCFVPGNIRE